MSAPNSDGITDSDRLAACSRMAEIFDRAAECAGVSPEEFRAAICESMQYAHSCVKIRAAYDLSPEAFVLSLLGPLF